MCAAPGQVRVSWFIQRSSDGAWPQWERRRPYAAARRLRRRWPRRPRPETGAASSVATARRYVARSSDGQVLASSGRGVRPPQSPPTTGRPRRPRRLAAASGTSSIPGRWCTSSSAPTDAVPADYDGDGRRLAVWRPANGTWLIHGSRDGALTTRQWGGPGDIPVPADYDGDGRADIAGWRGRTGEWWAIGSRDGAVILRQWGAERDIPLTGDYDGAGRADFTVYRP